MRKLIRGDIVSFQEGHNWKLYEKYTFLEKSEIEGRLVYLHFFKANEGYYKGYSAYEEKKVSGLKINQDLEFHEFLSLKRDGVIFEMELEQKKIKIKIIEKDCLMFGEVAKDGDVMWDFNENFYCFTLFQLMRAKFSEVLE